MKRFPTVLASVAFVLGCVTAAQADDRTVVVPKDTKAFKVGTKDVVRLTGRGIAGAQIKATVTGPAKVVNTNTVFERAGGSTIIGSSIKEFEVQPTGPGQVEVNITVTNPTGGGPKTTTYKFEVK